MNRSRSRGYSDLLDLIPNHARIHSGMQQVQARDVQPMITITEHSAGALGSYFIIMAEFHPSTSPGHHLCLKTLYLEEVSGA